jgi:hypothetical protein
MKHSTSPSGPRHRLRTWILGFLLVAAIPLFYVSTIGVRTCAPLQSAGRTRAALLEKYGPPEMFTPLTNGSIPGERMETFIQVRGALQDTCTRFKPLQASMNQVDEVGKNDDATGWEIAGTAGGLAEVTNEITPLIGDFFAARNEALLQARMGFGEYMYLYTLAYRDLLMNARDSGGLFTADGHIPAAVGTALLSMLTRQMEALGEDDDSRRIRQILKVEIRALQEDPRRVPYLDGLPAVIGSSLAPYRQALDDAFCPETVEIEMELYSGRALLDAIY